MAWFILKLGTSGMVVFAVLFGMLLMSCSSAPEPQPEPTKQEMRQDSDRFFHKMEKEEGNTSPSP